jgi:hypothetical protein
MQVHNPTPRSLRWGGVALVVMSVLVLAAAFDLLGRHHVNAAATVAPPPVSQVLAQPTAAGAIPAARPALPDHVLLRVPFTTQAPLGNWAQHQESCEASTLTMLVAYWQRDASSVIDPRAADRSINQIDRWKPRLDLNDVMMGELAKLHFGYAYTIVPNDPAAIAEQLSAGRPLIAEVRTHGLGNAHYPGYINHYEQPGWSVPHFVLIIGYDRTGVWLNDPGITLGRGYHISYAQLSHAIADLDQHHPALAQGQVLLVIAPEAPVRVRPGNV